MRVRTCVCVLVHVRMRMLTRVCAQVRMCVQFQEMKSENPAEISDTADPRAHQTLLGRLIATIDKYPLHEWEAASRSVDRPPVEDRAVSLAFINEYEQSLKFLMPSRYEELNSYVLQGTKQSDCQCSPEDECSHWHGSATDPSLCQKSWIIRAFTSKTTSRSVIETFMVAAKVTGDKSFVQDANGRPYFGWATVFTGSMCACAGTFACLHAHIYL